jgi:dipeptidyl aminopeptidase/acylaminoacyl peptidase
LGGDGAKVVWVEGSGPAPRLALAPSAGGPVLSVPLPVAAGDQVSDLGVSPDGSRLVYSVTHAGGDGELRLAALDDGATLAVSRGGTGESPNWSPAGDQVAVLAHSGGQPQIAVAQVPGSAAGAADSVQGVATAFANAQLSGDRDALRALASSGVAVDALPRASRATLVQVLPGAGGATRVSLRLVVDPTPAHPVARAIDEMVDLRTDPQQQRPVVDRVSATPPADVPPGPHVVRITSGPASGSGSGTIAVTFDSDLDAASVAGAFGLSGAGGGRLPATATYDAATRTVTVSASSALPAQVALTVGTGLSDVAGRHLAAPVQAPVAPA